MDVLDYLVEIKEISKTEKKVLQFLIIGTDKIMNPFNRISIDDISNEVGTDEETTRGLIANLLDKKLIFLETPFSDGIHTVYVKPNNKEINQREFILM